MHATSDDGTGNDGRITHLHLDGDPVRLYEPAVLPDPIGVGKDGGREQPTGTVESATIVLGRD
ncbi:hypothetical protein [Streptomyces sp. NPDC060194]|uniref:hypothetical protein n=1 Tax=Streptomyces sp. NPDC060194 TaxID=3347069 RepID=UPI0036519FC2